MKLCLGSVSCVIENRLESEDSELEGRLIRKRRSSGGDRAGAVTNGDASGGRLTPHLPPLSIPLGSAAVGGSKTPQRSPVRGSVAITAANGEAGDARRDIPLSQTWHGGGGGGAIGGPGAGSFAMFDQYDGSSGRGSGRGGTSARSRATMSRRWGVGKGSRVEDEWPSTDAPTHEMEAAAAETPSKMVKFSLGSRRRPDNGSFFPGPSEDGGGDGTSGAPQFGASARTRGGKGTAGLGRGESKGKAGGKGRDDEGGKKDPRAAVMNVTVQTRLWADYFNNTLRCWEALLDPFRYKSK